MSAIDDLEDLGDSLGDATGTVLGQARPLELVVRAVVSAFHEATVTL